MDKKKMKEKSAETTMEKLVALCKRRGFIFPGSEIYGGLANTWDYGPYGVTLKNNVKNAFLRDFVQMREDMVGLDASILMNPRVWVASGHTESFSDPLMDCKECHERVRGDKLIEEKFGVEAAVGKNLKQITEFIREKKIPCPKCGKCNFTSARPFNMMFKTYQGVIEEAASMVYLRPETAQGIFVNFKNILNTARKRLPFGVGQIGKAFRNEITPGNFTYRTREFEQFEIEYFIHPNAWEEVFEEWKAQMAAWYEKYGLSKEHVRFRDHDKEELSHYSKRTIDVEYRFPFGWGELAGLAYRTDFDLTKHSEHSGEDLSYLDPETNEKFVPHVIEPSFGVDRTVLTFLLEAYHEDMIEGEPRTILKLHPSLAPVSVAIFPLVKKEPLIKVAREIFDALRPHFRVEYDESGSIGKRYRRQDEIGTPFCVTVDFETVEKDQCVTIRDRDTLTQERVPVKKMLEVFQEKIYKIICAKH